MIQNDFTITKVSWITKVQRNYEFDESLVYKYYKTLINFLAENDLLVNNELVQSEITEETCIKKSDLTSEGLELMKKGYDKWSDAIIDKGKSTEDVKYLEKVLLKIRKLKK